MNTPIIFYQEDLILDRYGMEHGFSILGGVLVQWDEDQDVGSMTRAIMNLPSAVRAQLAMAYESKGSLTLVWKTEIPDGWAISTMIVCTDLWTVGHKFFAHLDGDPLYPFYNTARGRTWNADRKKMEGAEPPSDPTE